MPEYLTTAQIRTLNDARTMLKSVKTPPRREGGHADAIYGEAADAVFQALNVTRAYLGQPISDEQMHNRKPALEEMSAKERFRAFYPDGIADGEDAYESTDPKHPEFHSTHADLYDSREGK